MVYKLKLGDPELSILVALAANGPSTAYYVTKKVKKYRTENVKSLLKKLTEYKLQRDESYDRFCTFAIASASIPMVFEVVNIDGKQYIDGGVLECISIQKAIDEGCDEIDIISLQAINEKVNPPFENLLQVAMSTIDLMSMEVNRNDFIVMNNQDWSFYVITIPKNPTLDFENIEMGKD